MAEDMKNQAPEGDAEAPSPAPEVSAPTPEELAELRRKAGEYDALMDRLKRATADYLNSQKRMERDMQERAQYAIESFARELLLVADNLARAIESTRQHHGAEQIAEGINLVERDLAAVFHRHGIKLIDARTGQQFDPNVHEAISMVASEEHEAGRIVQEAQRGYQFRDRLLRPSRVIVSGGKPGNNTEK